MHPDLDQAQWRTYLLSRSICDLQSRLSFHALQIEGQTNLSVTGIWWCKHCQGCNHDPNCMAPSAQLAYSRQWPNRPGFSAAPKPEM